MTSKMKPEIICIGPLTCDYHINAGGKAAYGRAGGGAAYSAAGARIWNNRVGIVARIGPEYPEPWVEAFTRAGIDTGGVIFNQGTPLERVFGIYDREGNRKSFNPAEMYPKLGMEIPEELINYQSPEDKKGFVMKVSPHPHELPEEYQKAQAFHLAPMPLDLHYAWVKLLRSLEHRPIITVDPGPHYLGSAGLEEIMPLAADIDAFLPSESEMRACFPGESLEAGARQLLESGVGLLAVKIGGKGSLIFRDRGNKTRVPIVKVDYRDLTGAGDSYCGGFLAGLLEGKRAEAAAEYGSVSASFIVENFGSLDSLMVRREEAEKRLKRG